MKKSTFTALTLGAALAAFALPAWLQSATAQDGSAAPGVQAVETVAIPKQIGAGALATLRQEGMNPRVEPAIAAERIAALELVRKASTSRQLADRQPDQLDLMTVDLPVPALGGATPEHPEVVATAVVVLAFSDVSVPVFGPIGSESGSPDSYRATMLVFYSAETGEFLMAETI